MDFIGQIQWIGETRTYQTQQGEGHSVDFMVNSMPQAQYPDMGVFTIGGKNFDTLSQQVVLNQWVHIVFDMRATQSKDGRYFGKNTVFKIEPAQPPMQQPMGYAPQPIAYGAQPIYQQPVQFAPQPQYQSAPVMTPQGQQQLHQQMQAQAAPQPQQQGFAPVTPQQPQAPQQPAVAPF